VSEIIVPIAVLVQPTKQHVSMVSVLPVATMNDPPENSAALDPSKNSLCDKSAFSYRLALDNVTDEIVRTDDMPLVVELVLQLQHEFVPLPFVNQSIEKEGTDCDAADLALDKASDALVRNNDIPTGVAPVLRLQQEIAPLSVVHQINEEEGSDGESDGEEIPYTSVFKPHPFATVLPHRCPIITKDLETIQKALVVSNVEDADGLTTVVSKSSRKKKKGYQNRSRGPLPNPSQ